MADPNERTNLTAAIAKAHEMTGGNTDDILQAFEQWEAERVALSEFADISQAQDILLARATRQWKIVAETIWGKDRRPGEFALWQIREMKPKDLAKMAEAGEMLDAITKRMAKLIKAEARAVEVYIQLPLFKRQKT